MPYKKINAITVIGAGTMGHGIAQVAAQAGLQVVLSDVSEDVLGKGFHAIQANLAKGIERKKVTEADRDAAIQRIRTERALKDAVGEADLVVEAVPESLDLKKRIFQELDALVASDIVLATNTSSLPIGEIARASNHPERVIGMHFFNPVHIMALLEVVRGESTSDAVTDAVRDVGTRMGKECIVIRDSPGFATSRLGLVLGLEAIRMVEQGVGSAEDIDTAMTLGYRHPIGPLKLTDLVGLDVRLAIAEHLHRTLGETFRPPELLRSMVQEGSLGKKTGRGFFDWS